MIKVNIGEKIKNARKNAKLTQKELGEKLGVSEKTVSSWEINRTEPSMGMLERIAEALNIDKSELFDIDRQHQVIELFSGIGSLLKYADVFSGAEHIEIQPKKSKARTELDSITAELSETQVEKLIKFAKLIQRGEI